MPVRVLTDSSAVMPATWRDELPILVVPLQLAWPDGKASDDAVSAELVERLQAGEEPPATSAPSPGNYKHVLEELVDSGDEVLVVCPPSDLSTTYGSATLAAREIGGDRIRVLDASTAAAGQGIVAAEAARCAASGGDLEATVDRALHVATKVQMWATLVQLEFLRRSGRVPAVAAVGAGALRIQPIVRYAGGSPTPVGVTRSSLKGANRLFRAWERSIPESGGNLRVVVFHTARVEEATDLIERIKKRAAGADAHAVEAPASLAAHTGPGMLGLAWFWDK